MQKIFTPANLRHKSPTSCPAKTPSARSSTTAEPRATARTRLDLHDTGEGVNTAAHQKL